MSSQEGPIAIFVLAFFVLVVGWFLRGGGDRGERYDIVNNSIAFIKLRPDLYS